MAIFKPLFPSVLQRKIYCSAEENLLLRREKLFPPQRKKVSSAEKKSFLRREKNIPSTGRIFLDYKNAIQLEKIDLPIGEKELPNWEIKTHKK